MANISVNTTLLNETTDFNHTGSMYESYSNYTATFLLTLTEFLVTSLPPITIPPDHTECILIGYVTPPTLPLLTLLIYDNDSVLLNKSIGNNTKLQEYYEKTDFILHVVTYIIAGIGLPLLLMAIYALYSLVKNGQVAPIYIINLFITDLIQLCCLIVFVTKPEGWMIENVVNSIYDCSVLTSVCFMVCISLERYLLIAHPLWYRFRRTIRTSVVVCVLVWIIPPVLIFPVVHWVNVAVMSIIVSVFIITPFPLFIFFLVGTLRALSTSVSVPSDEKRRIVAILVLVLLIYTLLFIPRLTVFTAEIHDFTLNVLSLIFVRLSPLADLLLYVFIKKETFRKLWTSVCCCSKKNNDSNNTSTISLVDV